MDTSDYRLHGKEVVDYVATYLEKIRERRVFPDVHPGYMRDLVPHEAPQAGEAWSDIFQDVERVIMPGITHWQSPNMHAYFPALNSPASLLGDMIADGINCIGFTWAASPASTELEIIVTDWLCQMLNLPSFFLHSNKDTHGGGTILTTASEGTLVSLLAARKQAINKYRKQFDAGKLSDSEINSRLVAYSSDQSHSSVEKAALISLVNIRFLPCDDNFSLRGETVREEVIKDIGDGFLPFFVVATLGTTGACAFDPLDEIGPICKEYSMWLHVDSAYAGTSFVCPELRGPLLGIEYANSFVFNPSKWMMVHFDCTVLWVDDSTKLHRTFNVEPLYLKHENTGIAIDFMHWQIPLSKRFRALKLWFVIRSFGINGLREHVRKGVKLAKQYEEYLKVDSRFEMIAQRRLGVVTFRLKGDNFLTETLLRRLNSSGTMYMVPAALKGQYIIRYVVTSPHTEMADVKRDWDIIQAMATSVLTELLRPYLPLVVPSAIANYDVGKKNAISDLTGKRRQAFQSVRKEFGLSLLLSHVPSNPTFINGSYAAIFDNREVLSDFARQLTHWIDSRPMSFSPCSRFKLRTQNKQLSLDLLNTSVAAESIPEKFHLSRVNRRQRLNSLDSKVDEVLKLVDESEEQDNKDNN